MGVRKVTISVNEDLLDEVDALAENSGQSRSEWLSLAAARTIQFDRLRAVIDAGLAHSGGPVTAKERARARFELGLPGNSDADGD